MGEASYISLLDLQRVMQRALKRSGLPVWYTLGFNPHIYMTFSAPLSLGQESLAEAVDFKTETDGFDWQAQCALLSDCLPQGVDVTSMGPAQMDPSEICFASYSLLAAPRSAPACRDAFSAYSALGSAPVRKESKHGKVKTLDLKEYLPDIPFTRGADGSLQADIRLPAGGAFTLNPALVLALLQETSGLAPTSVRILRTALLTKNNALFC